MKRLTSVILSIILVFSGSCVSAHWADPYFEALSEKNILMGDEQGFRGDDPLLRCEFAAMLNRTFSYSEVSNVKMKDVFESDWYYHDMSKLYSQGILKGDEDGNLNPKSEITRAESFVMLARALKAELKAGGAFDETDVPDWAVQSTKALLDMGIISGFPDGKIHGQERLLRSEAAVLISNIIDKTGFAKGDGTEENPFIITSCEQFSLINKNLSAYYKLENDLDFRGMQFPQIGSEQTPFSGGFDGGFHRIVVAKGKGNSLFKATSKSAVVKNFYLTVSAGRVSVIGTNKGTLLNTASTSYKGEVSDFSRYFGNLAIINEGKIFGCYNVSEVRSVNNYTSAGIAGINNGEIASCYNVGATENSCGAIAGINNGKIIDCYSIEGKSAGGNEKNVYYGKDPQTNFSGIDFTLINDRVELLSIRFSDSEDFNNFDGGNGTEENPYRIKTAQHFKNISKKPEACFLQTDNFKAEDVIEEFYGSYDGGGFEISKAYVRENSSEVVALFKMNYGEIRNLKVSDSKISGRDKASGIVSGNHGKILNCVFYGSVTGMYASGICDTNYKDGIISECAFLGTTGADLNSAGVCIDNYGEISNVYVLADILGSSPGGVVFSNMGKLSECFFSGNLSGGAGISYYNYGEIANAYTDSEKIVRTNMGKTSSVAVRTQEQMGIIDMYPGFDFYRVWEMGNNTPVLKNTPFEIIKSSVNVTDFAGGDGSVTDPFKIVTPAHLKNISKYPDADFVLLNDIMVENSFVCDTFSGFLDGNSKSISGVTGPLFKTNSGTVKGLRLKGEITENESGAVCVLNEGLIQECSFEGEIPGNDSAGLCYKNSKSVLRCVSDGEFSGDRNAGIVRINKAQIEECYSLSRFLGENIFGISENDGGTVKNSWFGGKILSDEFYPISNSKVEGSFYLDFYGEPVHGSKTYSDSLDAQFSEFPWIIKDGLPALKNMPSAENPMSRVTGDGSEENPFEIAENNQIILLSMYPKSNFKLTKSLNFKNERIMQIRKFQGVLDGNGKTVSNFKISADKGGFFGVLNGKAENLTLSYFTVEGKTVSGGFAGENTGTIRNCKTLYGRIGTVGSRSGGFAGVNKGLLYGCFNRSDVFSGESSGGISGENLGTIVLCANAGGIVATADDKDAKSGGISGILDGVADRCYNLGKTLSYSESKMGLSGGISGEAMGSILNCYNTGEITAKAKEFSYTGGICGLLNKKAQIKNAYNTGFTNSTAKNAFSGSAIGFADGGKLNGFVYEQTLPSPIGLGGADEKEVLGQPSDLMIREVGFPAFDFENVWSFYYDNGYYYPQFKELRQDVIEQKDNWVDFAGGNGTLENPYIIITPEQLNNVRLYLGATFMLMGDIDMSAYSKKQGFTPIGDNAFSFFGVFIGNNFTVSGLDFKDGDFGLFRENHGEIYNLFFDNLKGSGSGGAVAKYNAGLIYNCVSGGEMKVNSQAENLNRGGLVGINRSSGMIISSYNTGDLYFSGKNVQAGGLVCANYGIISGSFNSGKIVSEGDNLSVSGGISAVNFGAVSDCYASDVVSATDFGGGISANNSGTVVNCYFSGDLVSAKKQGSILATNTGSAVNCYFMGNQAVSDGFGVQERLVKCTEEQMMESETFADFDFENMWIMDRSFKYKYPQFIEIAHRE